MLIKLNNPPDRAKAKTGKKQKPGPSKSLEASEQEKQTLKAGEAQTKELKLLRAGKMTRLCKLILLIRT